MPGANKYDLIGECNDHHLPIQDFIGAFCQRCKNPECDRAAWGDSLFADRVNTQADRLLHRPLFAAPDDPAFASIRAMHFQDMLEQAMQLEIADRRMDWQIPEIHVTDGRQVVATPDTTKIVDDAVRRLATAQGRTPPAYPDLPEPEMERVDQDIPDLTPMFVDTSPSVQTPRLPMNTSFPAEGVMVGSDAPPRMQVEANPSKIPGREATAPVVDPWAVQTDPQERVVEVGATIRLAFEKVDKETKK